VDLWSVYHHREENQRAQQSGQQQDGRGQTICDFFACTNINWLSWYAHHPGKLVRDVRERVQNSEHWTADYIVSQMPAVKGLPKCAAAVQDLHHAQPFNLKPAAKNGP
jgi:hypothetical protein